MTAALTAAVRARLEAHLDDLGIAEGRVYGALDLAQARPAIRAPGVVALPLADDAAASLASAPSPSVQRVQSTIAVVSVVPAPNDPGGSKGAGDALGRLYEAAREVLRGFVPIDRWDGLALRRGRLLALENGRAWWQDEFITAGYPAEE